MRFTKNILAGEILGGYGNRWKKAYESYWGTFSR